MSDYFVKYLSPIRIDGRKTTGWAASDWTSVNASELVTKAGIEYYVKAEVADKSTVSGGTSDYRDKYVKLDSNGKLDTTILPSLAITDTTVITDKTLKSGIDAAVVALDADVDVGDVVIFNPTLSEAEITGGTYAVGSYICTGKTTSGDTTTRTWSELTTASDGIIRINDKTSQYVTLNIEDLYAVNPSDANIAGVKVDIAESITAYGADGTEDYKFPTAKAVTAFASDASNLTSGTVSNDRLNVANYTSLGIASFSSDNFTVTSGAVSLKISTNIANDGVGDNASDIIAASPKAVATYVNAQVAALSTKATITGDATNNTFTITHGLGSADLFVQIFDASGNQVFAPVAVSSTTVVVKFSTIPASGTTYKVVMYKVAGSAVESSAVVGSVGA